MYVVVLATFASYCDPLRNLVDISTLMELPVAQVGALIVDMKLYMTITVQVIGYAEHLVQSYGLYYVHVIIAEYSRIVLYS